MSDADTSTPNKCATSDGATYYLIQTSFDSGSWAFLVSRNPNFDPLGWAISSPSPLIVTLSILSLTLHHVSTLSCAIWRTICPFLLSVRPKKKSFLDGFFPLFSDQSDNLAVLIVMRTWKVRCSLGFGFLFGSLWFRAIPSSIYGFCFLYHEQVRRLSLDCFS